MARMLERLEAKGLVERHRSSVDRRVVEVRLLEPGASTAAQVADVLEGALKDHLAGFSANERKRPHELLERMRINGRATAHR